ncbi:MAG: S8 family serine peptidase [Saprospiraceae bacterium]|nr:S8 family serine peptidase [Saprospiraceae bacterium]
MKKHLLLLLVLFSCLSANFAQKLNYVQDQLLVKPRTGVDMQAWAKQWNTFEGRAINFRIKEQVSQPMNIWLVEFDFNKVGASKLLNAIRQDKSIEVAQLNHILERRSTLPNDQLINLQWQYLNVGQSGGLPGADFDIDLAWDITTGGRTASGDTIVVCVIDEGIRAEHPDFAGNIWINHQEIANNGLDDDGNGFIDDRRGWNTARNNDEVYEGTKHGTAVAGIIGAKGNNGIGVSGVNWNVKMMIVRGGIGLESEAIEAYSYPLSLRKLYNQTNGQKGAFVVATNSSWGAEYLFPSEAPLWCSMYDSLGTQGILNAGATSNLDINVDEVGDLPSTCPSDYLISVTNLNFNNEKVVAGNGLQGAGFGAANIDLGAYGQDVWTIDGSTGYGPFGGTSAATPHVAGTIALLYSAPCAGFAALYKSDPKVAALLIRDFILQGAVATPSLAGITVTGGRLNINNSLLQLMGACSNCFPPTSLDATDITDTQAKLTWNINSNIQKVDLRWRILGSDTWINVANAISPFTLNNLLACTEYEFQLKATCAGEELKYTKSFIFKTDGCCEAPGGLQVSFIGNTIGVFKWNAVLAADRYTLQLRPEGTSTWRIFSVSNPTVPVNNLIPCTRYEVQLNSICSGEPSEFGETYIYRTPGCGACQDLAYCIPSNLSADEEWIAFVKVGTFQNTSGSNGGYADFTGLTSPSLKQGSRYGLELQPGFSGISFTEAFTVWIDFNQNGAFDLNEKVFEKSGNTASIKDSIQIPANANTGITRLRVAMQFLSPGGPCSFNVGTEGGAEVEDYCVNITEQSTATEDVGMNSKWTVFPNPFREEVQVSWQFGQAQSKVQLRLFNSIGQQIQAAVFKNLSAGENTQTLDLARLPAGIYWLQCGLEDGSILTKRIVKQ